MSRKSNTREKARFRELAERTLEAYRKLNSAAAEASFPRGRQVKGEELTRASELLESVVAALKGAA